LIVQPPSLRVRLGPVGGALAALCALAALLLLPAPAGAKFRVGFQEPDYVTGDASLREQVFAKTVREKASVVRLNAKWLSIVRGPLADPSNPADPGYNFATLDAGVREAVRRGLKPVIMFDGAPAFAEGPNRSPLAPGGTWRPNPSALAAFAHALASRYSGDFGGLPRVRYYQIWNEPNINLFLMPQRAGDQVTSPAIYRRMLNEAYSAIKGVDRHNFVVTAGNAPYGSDSGPVRVRPLEFLRILFCLSPDLKQRTCDEQVHFDALAQHPINTSGGPTDGAVDPDDIAGSDFKKVRKVLRAAERAGTAPGGHHQLWATEIWWVTNPPNHTSPFRRSLKTQARFIEQAFYVLWKQGADVVLNFEVHDAPYDPAASPYEPGAVQTGVFFRDFRPKPSATAFRFPFVADRRSKRKLFVWSMPPKKGKLKIQRRQHKGWRTIRKAHARKGKVFTAKLRLRGKAKLRATVKGERSLVWDQGR
jgi:hypothetical protein